MRDDADHELPAERARQALDELLALNDHTRGAQVADLLLGPRIAVAILARPVVIEGQWTDAPGRTADLFDLMDAHRAEDAP